MSRVSRRQHSKRKSALATPWPKQDLEILVLAGAHDVSGDERQISEDVALVRSALLYADKVRLVSGSAMMLFGMKQIMDLPPSHSLLFILSQLSDEQISRMTNDDSGKSAEAIRALMQYKSIPRKERRANMVMFNAAREALTEFTESARAASTASKENIGQMSRGYGADELQLAVDAGVLEVDLDWPIELDSEVPSTDRIIETLNSNNGNVMLDSQMRGLVGAMHKEKVYELPRVFDSVIRRTRTGTRMIENLPSFPDAPMESILQTRKETEEDQQKYRRKVSELSTQLREHALSDALDADIDDFWLDEVVPEVQQLQKVMAQSSAGIEAARRTAKDSRRVMPKVVGGASAGLVAGGGVVLNLGVTDSLPQAVGAALMGAVGGGAVPVARELRKRYQANYEAVLDSKEEAQSNGLLYLIDVNASL